MAVIARVTAFSYPQGSSENPSWSVVSETVDMLDVLIAGNGADYLVTGAVGDEVPEFSLPRDYFKLSDRLAGIHRAARQVLLAPAPYFIDPHSLWVDITMEILCEDEDQIISRPVGEGYTYADLAQSHLRFSSQDVELGCIPAEDKHSKMKSTGYCQGVEVTLQGKLTNGQTVLLGTFFSEELAATAQRAICAPLIEAELEAKASEFVKTLCATEWQMFQELRSERGSE